jgi:hypothetical protein
MTRKLGLAVLLASGLWLAGEARAQDLFQSPGPQYQPTQPLNKFYYYPYYYFNHNYWPGAGPKWPEPVGAPYMRPPAYMAYPPFREPHWRYEWYEPQIYHRGFHFWLDQF